MHRCNPSQERRLLRLSLGVAIGLSAGSATYATESGSSPDPIGALTAALQPGTPSDTADRLVTWMARYGDCLIFDPTETGFRHPAFAIFHETARQMDWRAVLATQPPSVHFEILRRKNAHSKKSGAADYVPSDLLFQEPVLRFLLEYLDSHAAEAHYDGPTQRITYPDQRLEDCVSLIWTFARDYPDCFEQVVQAPQLTALLDRLLRATNVENPRSRVEPSDHLVLHLERDLQSWLDKLQARPRISQAALRQFLQRVMRARFRPQADDAGLPRLIFARDDDPYSRRFEFLTASIGPLQLEQLTDRGWTPLATSVQPNPSHQAVICQNYWVRNPSLAVCHGVLALCPNRAIREVALRLHCPEASYGVTFEIETGRGRLPWTDGIRLDRAREAGTMEAIVTVALGETLSDESVRVAVDIARSFGYRVAEPPRPIADLKADFLQQVAHPHLACLIPVYHMLDLDTYPLGWNQARRFVLERRFPSWIGDIGVPLLRVFVYTPPPVPSGEPVLLNRGEFSGIFHRRLASAEPHDTLTVMNLSCDSQYTVEAWMAAFRNAIGPGPVDEIQPADVPLLIGTHRGFEESVQPLFLAVPAIILRSLVEGKSRTEILQALQTTHYGPLDPTTNLHRPELYDMGGNLRIRVVDLSDPRQETVY